MPDLNQIKLDAQTLNLANRKESQILFKIGSTYYARKHDGVLVSSSTVPETVIAAAIAQGGTLYFAHNQTDNSGATTDWILSGGFTGFTLVEDTSIVADTRATRIIVPDGFTGTAFTINGVTGPDLTVNIRGLEIREGGTPNNNWTGLKIALDSSTDYMYFSKFQDISIADCGTGIELETSVSSSAFITSCLFDNILIWQPRIGVLFDEFPGAQISDNLFNKVDIQATSHTTHGFKDVSGSRNSFVGCSCWDFPSTEIEMNILAGAKGTTIIGGRIGQEGAFIDQSYGTTIIGGAANGRRFNFFPDADLAKTGNWYGIAPTVGEGILSGRLAEVNVGTGANAGARDSTGLYRTFSSGATINSIAGFYANNNQLTARILNPYFKAGVYLDNNTNMRVFVGLIASQAAPASTADPLNALEGCGLWLDTAVSANWKRMHNDSASASAVDDTGIAAATGTLYPVEIYGQDDSEFHFILNGQEEEITGNIPASTTNLGFRFYIENTTAANRVIRGYYVVLRSDK